MQIIQIHNRPKVYQVCPVAYALLCALLALSWAASAAPSTPAADAGAGSGIVLELNDSTVNETIALYPFFVLDVYKPLCNPCQRMKQAINELSIELGGQAAFGMIDGRYNQTTERVYNITGHPTLLVFLNGTLVDKMQGFASKKYVVDRLKVRNPGLNTSAVTFQ
jgi:thioredoxin 1